MKKSLAIANRISSKMFDFCGKTGIFTAEISMLQHTRNNPLDRLYHDAADEGFVMVSEKTGDEVEFYLDFTNREADGDIRFWVLKPTMHSALTNQKVAFLKVVVYNT